MWFVMAKPLKETGPHGPEEDGTLVSSSARTFSRLIKKEKVRECMRHLRSLVNPNEGVEKVSTIATLENALKALKEANSRQASGTRGKKQSQSSGGGTQPSNALNTTSNTQSKSSSEGEEILSFSSLPYTQAKIYSLRMSLTEGEVVDAEKQLLQVLNYPLDSWRGCLLTNFVFDPDIPRLLTCLYHFAQNRKQLRETGSSSTGNKKQEQFCLRFRVNPSLSRGTFAAPSSDRYLPFLVKANYQCARPVTTAASKIGQTDQTSGRTYITCVSSGIGSETSYTTTARMNMEGAADDSTSGVIEQLTLSIARIEHFYTEPFYVPKRNRFATQLTTRCHLTNVDPILTSLIGFLPQDLEHVSIFDLVHTSDLTKIYDAYKEVSERLLSGSGERWTHVPPVRWRCCNGTDLLIQTNIRSHMEKTSGTVDCVYGLHEIMRGPEKLTRFFDPTVSNHFSRLWLSHQKHSQGNMNTNSNSMNTDQAEKMQGQSDDETTTTDGVNNTGGISGHSGSGDVTAASISWMVDPRRLRLKSLFQDLSQTELAHATSLGISLADLSNSSDVASVEDKKMASKDSVDLDNDSTLQVARTKTENQRRQRASQRVQRSDEENSLNVTLAARGFSYDAWNHYHQIQNYLISVQRETRRHNLQIRSSQSAAIPPDVLLPESTIPPGLQVGGRSLGSSAVVQTSDNDAPAIATDGEFHPQPRYYLPKSQDDRGNTKEKGECGEAAERVKTYTNALPLTVDNLQRHTRIQEKHYRLQMLHQLKGQLKPAPRETKTKWFDVQQQEQLEEQSHIAPQPDHHQQQSAMANASTASQTQTSQQQNLHGYRYRARQPMHGAMEKKRSETESGSHKKDIRAVKRKLPISKKRSSSTASDASGGSNDRNSNLWRMPRADMPTTSSADDVVTGACSSPRRHSEDNRRRCKFRKLGVDCPPTLGQQNQREPPTPQQPTINHPQTRAGPPQQPRTMFYGGPHTNDPSCMLGMPPVHFAECYPSRKPIHSSRHVSGRRASRRKHTYSGDHLDLYANATHPVPFYVPGTAAPPIPPPLPAQAATSRSGARETSRPHRSMAGVVPGAVPAAPFAGLWGLPSWGFVPLMPWHSYPGAPVQWPYYPQVGGALPPYLHGGFFGNPQQQQQSQQQSQQSPQQPTQTPTSQNKDQPSGPQPRPMDHRQPEPGMRRGRKRSSDNSLDCGVAPLQLASPQPSVIVTAHTEDQASEMLSSEAEGGSEGASSSFVYLLDSSHGSRSTVQPRNREHSQDQSQTIKDSDKSRTPGESDRPRTRGSRHPPMPMRGQPFWLNDVGSDLTEQTMMQYQIPCPIDYASSSTRSSNSSNENLVTMSNRNESRRQTRLWRRRMDKVVQTEERMDLPMMNFDQWRTIRLGAQVIELLQYGCSDDEGSNDHFNLRSRIQQTDKDGPQRRDSHHNTDTWEFEQSRRSSGRCRSKTSRLLSKESRDRSRLSSSRMHSVSSGKDSVRIGRGGSCSPWNSSIKESDGITGSDEGSGFSGIAESHSEMEPFLDCLFVGSNIIPMTSSGTCSFEPSVVQPPVAQTVTATPPEPLPTESGEQKCGETSATTEAIEGEALQESVRSSPEVTEPSGENVERSDTTACKTPDETGKLLETKTAAGQKDEAPKPEGEERQNSGASEYSSTDNFDNID